MALLLRHLLGYLVWDLVASFVVSITLTFFLVLSLVLGLISVDRISDHIKSLQFRGTPISLTRSGIGFHRWWCHTPAHR